MGPSGRRGAVIPVHGRWLAQLTVGWRRQRPTLVINRAPEMLSRLAYSIIPTLPAEDTRTHDQAHLLCHTRRTYPWPKSASAPISAQASASHSECDEGEASSRCSRAIPGFRSGEQNRLCRQSLLLGQKSLADRKSNPGQARILVRLSGRKYDRHGDRSATATTGQTNIQPVLGEPLARS